MVENRTEEQQVEQLRRWLRTWGRPLVTGLIAGLIALGGVRWYYNEKNQQAEAASVIYQQLLENIESDRDQAATDAKRLTEEFLGTPYASLGALYLARFAVEDGELERAGEWLRWALQHPLDKPYERLARLRLARVLTASAEYDQALEVLESTGSDAYSASYFELRGDIHQLRGDYQQARAAYSAALESLTSSMPQIRELIQLKLDNLGNE